MCSLDGAASRTLQVRVVVESARTGQPTSNVIRAASEECPERHPIALGIVADVSTLDETTRNGILCPLELTQVLTVVQRLYVSCQTWLLYRSRD